MLTSSRVSDVWCLTITGKRNSCSSKVPNMGRTNLWEELNCCIMLPGQEIPTAEYSESFNKLWILWGASSREKFLDVYCVFRRCSMHSLQWSLQLLQWVRKCQRFHSDPGWLELEITALLWCNILRVQAAMSVVSPVSVHSSPYSDMRRKFSLWQEGVPVVGTVLIDSIISLLSACLTNWLSAVSLSLRPPLM